MSEAMVQIPRAEFTEILWSRPFSELLAMAERGEHGMSVRIVHSINRESHVPSKMADWIPIDHPKKGEPKVRREYLDRDVCLMRKGRSIVGDNDDKALLHAQNW